MYPHPLGPIFAVDALWQVEARLVELLRRLTREEWDRPTIVPGWRVRHVAGHLMDTALRKLSVVRDGFAVDGPRSGSAADVLEFVNRANAEGAALYGRLSPEAVAMLMEPVGRASCEFHSELDPFAKAAFAVSWAGEAESLNWFDTARELTERWHHQQQIRLAIGRDGADGILTPPLYGPVLDCFVRALPFRYAGVMAEPGVRVDVRVSGACGGTWLLYRGESAWMLSRDEVGQAAAVITLPQEIAWRVFTKGIRYEEALAQCAISGAERLALPVLSTLAIVG